MARKSGVSAADMEALFAHALVQPKASTGEGAAEERAAKELGVTVLGALRPMPIVRTWRVRDGAGKVAALVDLAPSATPAERERFAAAATQLEARRDALGGILPVRRLAQGREAFLTDLWTTGTAKDLSALAWPLRRRIEFTHEIAQSLSRLHAAGLVHGCLCPDNILLDDDLHPVLSEAGLVDVAALSARREGALYEPFAASERKEGSPVPPSADVFALGKILHALCADANEAPPALAHIVGRCVSPPMARYATMEEMGTELHALIEALRRAEDPRATNPGPTRPAVRPDPATRRETPAIAFPVPGKPAAPEAPWQPPLSLGLLGLSFVVAAGVAAALVGATNDALTGLLSALAPLGAAMATTLLPGLPRAAGWGRLVLAAGVATLMTLLSPLPLAYRFAAQRHLHGNDAARRRAVEEILGLGSDFRGMSLAGANLSGLDLGGADLRGVNASGANFANTSLFAAEVEGANFDRAELSGADLSRVQLQLASLGSARCDDATRLPVGWSCSHGRLDRQEPPVAP